MRGHKKQIDVSPGFVPSICRRNNFYYLLKCYSAVSNSLLELTNYYQQSEYFI